jgi:hypothetical protein
MKHIHESTVISHEADELQSTIKRIGIARFVGRVNSGVIESNAGYAAVEAYVQNAQQRPLVSRITGALLGARDTYLRR